MGKFVTNCWYMVAWSEELNDGPVARRLLDMPVVLFRTQAGEVAALIDRCPHRFAPLSRGKIDGDSIRCGYHGLAFDPKGKCSDSPFNLAVPPGTDVRSFPAVEQDDCVWFWPGDPALADPANIPVFPYHQDPKFRVVHGRSHIKADFELVTDNLMDLTHTRYLHPAFGGDIWVPKVEFSQDGETIFSHYDLPSYPATEFSEAFIPSNGRSVFERDVMRWNAPASMLLMIEMGFGDQPDVVQGLQPSSHILCPETETTCHYFWASGAEADAPVTDEDHYEGLKYAFDLEDAPMLEAVQDNMDGADFWDLRPAILAYDSAGIRARRIMRQKLRAENGVAAEEAVAAE